MALLGAEPSLVLVAHVRQFSLLEPTWAKHCTPAQQLVRF
jgi:hypothetical protein